MAILYYLLGCCILCADALNFRPSSLPINNEDELLQDPNTTPFSADIPRVVEEPVCDLCSRRNSSQCQIEDYPGCKCDAMCKLYGDCCVDPPECESSISDLKDLQFKLMECNSLYHEMFASTSQETYWMVSRCPEQLSVGNIINSCSTGSVAPVSDEETGFIYRNEYCAVCNSANSIVRWPFTYTCNEGFRDLLSNESVALDSLLENCSPCRYVKPRSLYNNSSKTPIFPPRSCVIHTAMCQSYEDYLQGLSELLQEEFENAEYHCKYGSYNIIGAILTRADGASDRRLYKNAHCALCNGAVIPDTGQCAEFSNSDLCLSSSNTQPNDVVQRPGPPISSLPEPTFNLLLDINRDGATIMTTTETVTSAAALQTTCNENEVFDPVAVLCREIICPPSYVAVGGTCVQTIRGGNPSLGTELDDVSIVSPNPNKTHVFEISDDREKGSPAQGSPDVDHVHAISTSNGDTATPTTCLLMTLVKGHDNFTIIGNDSVVLDGARFTIVDFDDSQNPMICTTAYSFNGNSLLFHFQRIKRIVPGLFITPFLAIYLLAVGLQILLRQLHSVYGMVIINLGLTLILNDIFLWSTFNATTSLDVLYFLWHASSLAVACWLCVLLVHITLSFRKMCKHPRASATFVRKAILVCLYIIIGWGLSLLIVLINNEVYGLWSPCLNNSFGLCGPMTSTIGFFVVPVGMAVAFCVLFSVIICVKLSESLGKQNFRRFYFFLALLLTFAVGWIFGFIYLLSPSPLISTIGLFVFFFLKIVGVLIFFFGLVFTKKLRQTLRQSCFSCCRKNRVQPLTHKLQAESTAETASSSVLITSTPDSL